MAIGQHSTWDIYNCDKDLLSYVAHIDHVLHTIINELSFKKVDAAFKQFAPVGVTGFILLEESHISIHTWPEHAFAAVDIFSCQRFDAEQVTQLLKTLLQSDNVTCQNWERGDVKRVNALPGMLN